VGSIATIKDAVHRLAGQKTHISNPKLQPGQFIQGDINPISGSLFTERFYPGDLHLGHSHQLEYFLHQFIVTNAICISFITGDNAVTQYVGCHILHIFR